MLVCPECGSDQMEVRRSTYMTAYINFSDNGSEIETGEFEILDSDDSEDFDCSNCGANYFYPDDLIPEDEYGD